MRVHKFRVTLLLFLNITVFLNAQTYRYKFKTFNVDEGLAHTDATTFVQDDNGFIWIGTFGGINKFDGYSFTKFRNHEANLKGAYTNRINDFALYKNLLFAATEGGIVCFDIDTERFMEIEFIGQSNASSNERVVDLLKIVGTSIYAVSSRGTRLYDFRYKNDKITFSQLGEIPNNELPKPSRIVADDSKRLWCSTEKGLYLVNDGHIQKLEISKGNKTFSNEVFTALYIDNGNTIWVGGEKSLIELDYYSLDGNRIQAKSVLQTNSLSTESRSNDSKVYIHIYSITKTGDGNLWLGTNDGLIAFANKGQDWEPSFYGNTTDNTRNKISSIRVNSLFTDVGGNLWVGTYGGGVNYTDVNQKQFYLITVNPSSADNSLTSNFIRAIEEDEKGNIWVGTERKGLCYYDFYKEKFTIYEHNEEDSNTILSNNIRSLELDSNGNLWVGMVEGITVLDLKNNTYKHLVHDPDNTSSLTRNAIFSLKEDKFGNIWAGSWTSGLNKITYTDGQLRIKRFEYDTINTSKSLTSNIITKIYADQTYPEVFVSANGGLNHIFLDFEGRVVNIKNYIGDNNDESSLSSNFVWPVQRENDSTLWVGTIGGGLNKVFLNEKLKNGYRSERFGTSKNAPSSDVESLLLDDDGNLWIGGDGLSKLDRESNELFNYRVADGLQGNSFKIGAEHKGEKSGRIYFGGTQGITYFYPDDIKSGIINPKIVLTDFSVNNKPVPIDQDEDKKFVTLKKHINELEEIVLNPKENNFTISFSSLHFANPTGTRYKYKLEGFDEDWVDIEGTTPIATYANLNYGDYVFKVNSGTSNNVWSSQTKSLKIKINAPWYATNLAKVIYGLLFLVFCYLFFRWFRLKRAYDISLIEKAQKEEINRLRLQFFTNISHEFRTPLTLIVNPLQELLKGTVGKRKRMRYYSHMLSNSKRMLRLINELMDFQKIEAKAYELRLNQENIEEVIREIKESFVEFSFSKGIDFEYIPRAGFQPFWFDRTVVEKTMYNLLGNAFKFTDKGGCISIVLSNTIDLSGIESYPSFEIGSLEEQNGYVIIRVNDSGRGIPENQLEHIFDRFFHKNIEDSLDMDKVGSGIGLSLVKSLVTLHKGYISVHSKLNVGTTFFIAIPYQISLGSEIQTVEGKVTLSKSSLSPVQEAPNVNPDIIQDYGKSNILVVEDNKELRYFLKENFEDEFLVYEAENGEEALELLENHRLDLVVSDIKMPKMDGISLCKAIKSSDRHKEVPLILLTSNLSMEKQLEGANAKADLYISKPFSLDVLKINIQNIISNRKALKSRIVKNTFAEAHNIVEDQKDNDFIKEVMRIIYTSLGDNEFDVLELSRRLNMSRTNVYNKVKSITGKSAGILIREARIKKAAELLASEDISIAEAMYDVGIQSQSYFTKVFKKKYQKTPSQFVQDISLKEK